MEEQEIKKEEKKTRSQHSHENKKEKLLEEKIKLLEEALANEQDKTLRLNAGYVKNLDI